jgi:amino acid adenylation domain-containing protein
MNLPPVSGCGPEGLVDDFLRNARRSYPDKVALVADGASWTYTALDEAANRLAHALLAGGLSVGDRVAIFLDNRAETILSVFGVLKAGGAIVLVGPTTKPDKLAFLLNDSEAHALILPTRATGAQAVLADEVRSVRHVLTVGDGHEDWADAAERVEAFEALTGQPSTEPARRCIDMDLAAILYTSGSTGRPKGVTVTHRNMLSAATSITTYLANVPEDIILCVLPLAFDYGLYQVLMAARMGARIVLEKNFAYPVRIVQRVKEEGVTGFPGVPTMFALLLQRKELDPALFDSVRYLTNTGAALPHAHIQRLRELFRHARVYSMYGVTESKRVTYLPPAEVDRRPGSVGRGMPNEEVYLVDEEGRRLPDGAQGELVVRGSNVMRAYWRNPAATAAALQPGRYSWEKVLHTGDVFRTDEDGYLYFVSRKDDIIKTRGEKVSPREVEAVIAELPDVRDVAVVGVADEILGEAVKAFVVLTTPGALTERDIARHCTQRLESFMVPRHIEVRDELPRTDSGKVKHRDLKDGAAALPSLAANAAKTAATGARFCLRCVLPHSFPGVKLDERGVCNHCQHHQWDDSKNARVRRELRARFTALADEIRPREGYHVLLAYSGGKDSTYTMWLLREVYDLRVLAVTVDNGFISPQAFTNMNRAVEQLGVDLLTVKPSLPLLCRVFADVVRDSPYPPKALERASSACNACIAFVKNATWRVALEKSIPVIAYGWSPGQAPTRAALQQMGLPLMRQMHDTRTAPLIAIAGAEMSPFTVPAALFAEEREAPYNVNPLAFHDYAEDEVIARIRELGWERPKDTDGNSSNCRLNAYAIRQHVAQLGFHPYAFEVASLVRAGATTREAGFASLADFGPESVHQEVRKRLGVE